MKINFNIAMVICMFAILPYTKAFAVVCQLSECTSTENGVLNSEWNFNGVQSYSQKCFSGADGVAVYTANSCKPGYPAESGTMTIEPPISSSRCTVTYTYCACSGCTSCTSDTSWSSAGTGYEKKVTRTCDCNTCRESTSYRCAAGYYGSSTNGTSGCTKCSSEDGATGTSAAGSTARTSCYIASGTSFSNTSGSGTFTGKSYYCN